MSDKKNVLVLGGSAGYELAKQAYPEDQYNIDLANKKLVTRKTDHYDEVLLYHVLQLQAQNDVIDYLKKINRTMKVGAQITVMVPSVDWVVSELAFEKNPSPVCMFVLYGVDGEHKSGHNLRSLRRDMALAGFAVSYASEGYYQILIQGQDGIPGEVNAGQAIVIGVKRNEVDNAPYQATAG